MTKDLTNLLDEVVIKSYDLIKAVLAEPVTEDNQKVLDESLDAYNSMLPNDVLIYKEDFIMLLHHAIVTAYKTLPECFREHIDFNDTEAKVLEVYQKVEINYQVYVIVPKSLQDVILPEGIDIALYSLPRL